MIYHLFWKISKFKMFLCYKCQPKIFTMNECPLIFVLARYCCVQAFNDAHFVTDGAYPDGNDITAMGIGFCNDETSRKKEVSLFFGLS